MAIQVLTNAKLLLGGYDLSGDFSKLALEDGVVLHEVTAFGDAGKRRVAGLGDLSFSGAGYWNRDAAKSDVVIFPDVGVADRVVTIAPAGITEAARAYLFRAAAAEYIPAADVDAPGAFTVRGEGSAGERLVRGTVLRNAASVSATGNGTGQQLGAISAGKTMYAALHVLTAGTTMTALIESDDGSGFASPTTQITFDAATAIGSQWKTLAGAVTDDWWRVRISAITGTFSFVVAVGQR